MINIDMKILIMYPGKVNRNTFVWEDVMGKVIKIAGGTVVSSKLTYSADIVIRDEKIEAIAAPGTEIAADVVIDASGKFVIPGGVDEHTHMMDPGLTEREEFETGTAAAAYGGITTVVDHHRTVPAVYGPKELAEKIELLNHKAVVDFGLKGGISPTNREQLKPMWAQGVTGFKTFTCNLHGVLAMNTASLFSAFSEVKRFNGTVLIHCEDTNICDLNEKLLKEAGRVDYASQNEWRSELAEEIAVKEVIAVARETGVRIVIAHVSQAKLLRLIHEARESGVDIYAETCPHYLFITDEDIAKIGPYMKFTPPARDADNLEEMWRLFNLGYVTTIGSDHCPYPVEEKRAGEKNIWDAPNGIPGVETSMRIMLDCVNRGRTSLSEVVRVMCENPAKMEGLYPKKGAILPGADADICILDMNHEETIQNENVVSKCKWSPYDGYTLKGAPETVLCRGHVVVDHYKVVGEPGFGRFVKRLPEEMRVKI